MRVTSSLISQSIVRLAQHQDTAQMAKIMYDNLSQEELFRVLYPGFEKENWLSAHANYCAQHIGQPHSVAFVTQNDEGVITGMAYGRFSPEAAPVSVQPVIGRNDEEMDKLASDSTNEMLIDRYGGVFWLSQLHVSSLHRGKGLGQALIQAMIMQAKRCHRNVVLAGAAGKNDSMRNLAVKKLDTALEGSTGFYEKHGFKEIKTPVMLGGGKVTGSNKMLLEMFSAGPKNEEQM